MVAEANREDRHIETGATSIMKSSLVSDLWELVGQYNKSAFRRLKDTFPHRTYNDGRPTPDAVARWEHELNNTLYSVLVPSASGGGINREARGGGRDSGGFDEGPGVAGSARQRGVSGGQGVYGGGYDGERRGSGGRYIDRYEGDG